MWLHHLTFPVTVNNVNTVYVAGDVCELENEKYIAWQMVVSLQQRVQKINSDIQTLGDKIKADEYLHLSGGEYQQVGRGVQQGGEVIHDGTKEAGGLGGWRHEGGGHNCGQGDGSGH